ncbi:hypothetical protein [Sphingomonas oleivorans]|nr:hypothetical protein [Sphingomonas oleivorans]
MKKLIMAVAASAALAACGMQDEGGGAPQGGMVANALLARETATSANGFAAAGGAARAQTGTVTDDWIGRWTGPEGLFLEIAPGPSGGTYMIRNRYTLDDEATFEGRAEGNAIRLFRAGREELIRAGTGAETGFKWLAEKKDCLIVRQGVEGYCRD